MRLASILLALLALVGCGGSRRLTVAAASNLTGAFDEIGRSFTEESGVEVVLSYGSTAALARQVEDGAPLDVFAAADKEHIDALKRLGKLIDAAVYARGQLAIWAPQGGVGSLKNLADPKIKFLAIAQPELAPYGKAAVETLQAASIWDAVQPKLVYANSVNQAKQFATTGNADAAFTAYSLVFREPGSVLVVDAKLHAPLEQAMGVVAASPRIEDARKFAAFVLGPKGREILTANGYLTEPSNPRPSQYPSR